MQLKCIKNASNRQHEVSKRLSRRLQDGSGRILPPFWAPTWGQVGAMLATFPAQDASKTPPRRSKMPSNILSIAQDGPRGLQTCPGALQTSIFDDFLSIFCPFLIDFWLIFCPFLIDFSYHFKIQWDRMGLSLCAERWRFILSHMGGAWLYVGKGTWLCIGSNILYIWFSTIRLKILHHPKVMHNQDWRANTSYYVIRRLVAASDVRRAIFLKRRVLYRLQ